MTPREAFDQLQRLEPGRFFSLRLEIQGSRIIEERWTIATPSWSYSAPTLEEVVTNISLLLKNATH